MLLPRRGSARSRNRATTSLGGQSSPLLGHCDRRALAGADQGRFAGHGDPVEPASGPVLACGDQGILPLTLEELLLAKTVQRLVQRAVGGQQTGVIPLLDLA